MQIEISPSDISFIALQGGDIQRFLRILRNAESPFSRCVLNTCWGLIVAQFYGEQGHTTCAVTIGVLDITKDVVVSDQGQWVDRYEKVVEELVKRASDKLKLPVGERDLKRRNVLVTVD